MNKVIKTILITITIIVIVFGAAVGTEAYGYSKLEPTFNSSDVSPEFDFSLGSGLRAALNVSQGNLLQAAASFIKGLKINGTVEFHNNSFVPLYLPSMNHQVTIEGKPIQQEIKTEATWILPHNQQQFPFNLSINKSDIPDIALGALANGGEIRIKVDSQISLGAFTITKETNKQVNVLRPLTSQLPGNSNSSSTLNPIPISPPPLPTPPSLPTLPSIPKPTFNIGDLQIVPSPIGTTLIGFGQPMLPPKPPLPAYVDISIRLHINNPTASIVALSGINYRVNINGNFAGNGSSPGPYTVPSKSTLDADSYFRAEFDTGGSIVMNAIFSHSFQIQLTGTANYQVSSQSGQIPFTGLIQLSLPVVSPTSSSTPTATYPVTTPATETQSLLSDSLSLAQLNMDALVGFTRTTSSPPFNSYGGYGSKLIYLTAGQIINISIESNSRVTWDAAGTATDIGSVGTNYIWASMAKVDVANPLNSSHYSNNWSKSISGNDTQAVTVIFTPDETGYFMLVLLNNSSNSHNCNYIIGYQQTPATNTTPPITTTSPPMTSTPVTTTPMIMNFKVSGGPLGFKKLTSYLVPGQQVNVSFTSSGGSNDINVYINDPSNTTVAGSATTRYHNSGQIILTASISGSYNLYFDNRFSPITSKNIQVTITGGQWN